ncbi:putative DsbA family dithiol-disulfide isomerase [Motilibacter rhizosphaerae]|uniref:Putative DsbA family dithiol-disulfide isomerase n=1 Tax=Motilibacter rhizosphaerae TaxID=598652 RepID=A0A4Q7NUW2_9ACTN|nr:DsbA family oxidoreductase [Motilibacter rhizosphaerae]RZS90925.1 putative DsbA family dithiol-disulfide isomerase [Motilibacter rhizosphaerae]
MSDTLRIDVWSDVACPWCYIGKHRLERALAAYDGEVEVVSHAFLLDPSAPAEARPLDEHLAERFGADRVPGMQAHVTGIAAAEGLELHLDRALAVSTRDAHRLLALGRHEGVQPEVQERLFRAYFTEGRDLGDLFVLAEIGVEAGLDGARVREWLAGDHGAEEVEEELATARDLGITAVPTFVIDRRYAVQGAQEPATLLRVLEQVSRERRPA